MVQLLAPLGHEATVGRAILDRDVEHRVRHGHLEVDARLRGAHEHFHVANLDVPPVLAQVHGDAVRTGLLGEQRGQDRIGVARAAGLPQRSNVIDVNAEMNRFHMRQLQSATDDVLQYEPALQRPLAEMRAQHSAEQALRRAQAAVVLEREIPQGDQIAP